MTKSGDRPEYEVFMDFFERDGAFLGSYELTGDEGLGRFVATDKEGNLYCQYVEPFPRIARFRIEFDYGVGGYLN